MSSFCLFLLSCLFFFIQKTAYELRISDWSSDVCSSDLGKVKPCSGPTTWHIPCRGSNMSNISTPNAAQFRTIDSSMMRALSSAMPLARSCVGERKSVVEGKSVSVRVDLGDRRLIKKKKCDSTIRQGHTTIH